MKKGLEYIHKAPLHTLFIILVFIIGFFTYFRNYSYPANLFWDENYHIASAEKYLHHTFFMEPHPPLGKLVIALGEAILQPNKHLDTRSFLTTDYIKDVPNGFSFAGVRFFPTLFAVLAGVLFYLVLYKLSRRPFLSFLFTSLYLFENALIVHSRGAMLESTQLFFVLAFFLHFVTLFDRAGGEKKLRIRDYLVSGALFGLIMATKLNGFMCGMLFVIIALYEESMARGLPRKRDVIRVLRQLIFRGVPFALASIAVFAGTYYVHFAVARTPVEGRYYEASEQYKRIIDTGKTASVANFPRQMAEHIGYIFHYEKGVPKYDYCKPDENGSLPLTWPFGDKSINYRWSTKDGKAQYLYLQGNPAVWFAGLAGIFLAVNILTAFFVLKTKPKNRRLFMLTAAFLLFYLAYMASMVNIERVMYLYHYFIGLVTSLILFFLVIVYLFDEQMKKGDMTVYAVSLGIVFLIIAAYLFFSPLTYYLPITRAQFELRNWFPFWGLKSVL